MTEKEFNFWQDHSTAYLDMVFSSDHVEVIANPDGYAKQKSDCGDTIELFLVLKNQNIARVGHSISGCQNTYACANTVAHLVEGQPVRCAWEITPQQVADFLETLSTEHFHCAELAVHTLQLALANLDETWRAPWKKLYR